MPRVIVCKNCGKEKKHQAKGFCGSCYNKLFKKEKIIICKNCGKEKKHRSLGLCLSCYMKQRKNKGKIVICKDCGEEKIHEAKGLCSSCWDARKRKTLDGFVSKMYTSMKARTRKKGFKKIIERNEFLIFAKQNVVLKTLFLQWEKSKYKRNLTPSVDRKDNDKGYLSGNIQFLTLSENDLKKFNDGADNGHRIKLIFDDGKIVVFNSMKNASKYIGKSHCYIREVLRGRIPAKGFKIISLSNQEYLLNRDLDPYYPYFSK